MKNKNNRFEVIHDETGLMWANSIIVDKITGVHYLFTKCGYGGGLTPLLDENGKPIIKKVEKTDENQY